MSHAKTGKNGGGFVDTPRDTGRWGGRMHASRIGGNPLNERAS